MKKFFLPFTVILLLIGCTETPETIQFVEISFSFEEGPEIELNYPEMVGDSDLSTKVNSKIQSTIASEMSLSEEINFQDIEKAIPAFKKEYNDFNQRFPDSDQLWELFVDSEVIYQSPEIISISISTYIDTGGAHGNTNVIFLNFDPESGDVISTDDLVKDRSRFTELVKKYFKESILEQEGEFEVEDSFYGTDFKLPETIGFSDEGVII
ncbi:MAG: DUF4163 domain-containing protein, partial [Flavobacteriaceae bacterium]|nr:DUF4163 domain-containing protein [Flavobacteriaceae bacterium]